MSCPSCGFEITRCPQCGYATTFFPRHGPRGSGAHYANRIVRLTPMHLLCLKVLEEHDGLGLTEVWKRVREIIMTPNGITTGRNVKVPTKQGVSGRLSELAGLGKVKTMNTRVQLLDPCTQQYRYEHQPKWYLANGP